MTFHGVLFDRPGQGPGPDAAEPPFFGDLNLDLVVARVLEGREEYDLAPFFHGPLADAAAVRYRHEVLRDLQAAPVRAAVESFAGRMRLMRGSLARAQALRNPLQAQRWFLDAVESYCAAARALADALGRADLRSRGLRAFRAVLADHTGSDCFRSLAAEAQGLIDALAAIAYRVHIRGNRVTVARDEAAPDYGDEVQRTFERFARGDAADGRVAPAERAEADPVEARVLELVARLHPDVFAALDEFCTRRRDYVDAALGAFDREAQFYLAYLEHMERVASAGLHFCYPEVCTSPKETHASDAFDLALAGEIAPRRPPVVCNDVLLTGRERILVVTGPNQGGKTTFARMFGQLHHLAALGLPVPARAARLFLADRVFTHFEREDDPAALRSTLEDDLVRMRAILDRATPSSIVVVNESFTSTTADDALRLSRAVMGRMVETDLLCVWVTFLDELASLGEATVSMVGTVAPDDPAVRTYAIVRRPADGLAYAAAIADKYGLGYERLRRRVAS